MNFKQVLIQLSLEQKMSLMCGNGLWKTAGCDKIGLRSLVMTDGTYGVRYNRKQIEDNVGWDYHDFVSVITTSAADSGSGQAQVGTEILAMGAEPATCFPNGSSVACSWDIALMERMGQALAVQCQHFGVDLLLGPGVNIRRTPLGGRGYEYYSEDPLLTGDIAAALINGLQGQGVGAVLKHFACNNSEYRRTEMNSVVDERALREIYLYGFQRAIEKSQPWALMTSYNDLNGEPTSSNPWLLNEILRCEWGYDGLVMSDWYGVKNRIASLAAGTDLAMPEVSRYTRELRTGLEKGLVPVTAVDQACRRLLKLAQRFEKVTRDEVDFSNHHALAQELARNSIVLLKNQDDLLPLVRERVKSIGILGLPAISPVIQGSGCATTRPTHVDIPLDEIFELAGVDYELRYSVGASQEEALNDQELREALEIARVSDVVVLFASTAVGKDGENGDRQNLDLLPSHNALIEAVSEVNPRTVVVLANGDAVVMPWLARVGAVLETFFSGQGMGRAIAEILFGAHNPCGKLTVTFPTALEQTPGYLQYPGEHRQHVYSEGLFVGYRYYEKRDIVPLFPFGHGLSYTRFEYKDLKISAPTMASGEHIDIQAVVRNSGKMEGKEIVQLYVLPPAAEVPREIQALKGFVKLSMAAGQEETASFKLKYQDLARYDTARQQWVVDPGRYTLHVSRSSATRDLIGFVDVVSEPNLPFLDIHSPLSDLCRHPQALRRVAHRIAGITMKTVEDVECELHSLAPEIFCGMYVGLVDMLGLEISERALREDLGIA